MLKRGMSDVWLIVAPMANASWRPRNPGRHKDQCPVAGHEDGVVPIPQWAWFVLVPGGLLSLVVFTSIGMKDGAGDGWALCLAVVTGVAALLAYSYIRRRKAYRERKRQALLAELAISDADQMTWQQFEVYCGNLLVTRHYENVQKTRNVPREKRVDFTAIDPEGIQVAVECKHRSVGSVGARLAHELAGKVTFGLYKEHAGILMTNASVTAEAEEIAAEVGIEIVNRELLAQWRAEALHSAEQDSRRPEADGSGGWLHAHSAEAKVAASVVTAACLVVLGVAVQIAAIPHSAAAGAVPSHTGAKASRPVSKVPSAQAMSKPSAPPTAAAVVGKFLAAISSHDWPEVWKLGGKNIGRGPYASYPGMITGYQGTIRDVLTMLRVTGRTVSGQFLAYQTDGEVRTYTFTYVVRGGTITSADQNPVRTVRYQTG
jgi:hypothetical protein